MKVDIQEIDSCKRQLNIEVPVDILNREIDIAYESLKKRTVISGFRKGRVPRHILEKHYGKSVQQEVLQKIIPETCKQVIDENKLKVAGQPIVEDIKTDGKSPLLFTATVDIIPDIKIKDYTGLKFNKTIKKITGSDVDREMKLLQERFAEFDSVEDKPVEETDYVVIDIESIGGPITDEEERVIKNHPVIVGSNSIVKEIEEGLINMKKGEEKEVTAAGKEVAFRIKVNEVKKKRLREIDDAFAKEIGNCDTFEDLKKAIMDGLEAVEKNQSETVLKKDIIKKLIEENAFDVPAGLVDEQVNIMIEEAKRRSAHTDKKFDPEISRHDQNLRETASGIVKGDILLDIIADMEKMEVSEEAVDEEITKLASHSNVNFNTAKKNMDGNGSLERLRSLLRRDKTAQFLLEKKMDIEEIFVES